MSSSSTRVTTTSSPGALIEPIQVGDLKLSSHIVLAPLTRVRNDPVTSVPGPLAAEYYSQRGSVPGTLLITEGTIVSPKAHGQPGLPGAWTDDHFKEWKKIVDAVHSKGSYLFLQLFALGFGAVPEVLKERGLDYVSASDVPLSTQPQYTPRPLTSTEIDEYVQDFAKSAERYVNDIGGDGVEVHAANGYLLDQFLQTNTNKRTDEYGGSVENRARFLFRVVEATVKVVGERKVGVRISPWNRFQDMRMPDKDIVETFSYVVRELKTRHPNLAYIHVIEPRIDGPTETEAPDDTGKDTSDFVRELWSPSPYIAAGGFLPPLAAEVTTKYPNVLVAFGRYFIANPDLVTRVRNGKELSQYNRNTFFGGGAEGYTDYPFYS